MRIVKEVADGIGIVADGIDHIRTMAVAVRTGREYFINRYPEIQKHVAAMCVEMRNTAVANRVRMLFDDVAVAAQRVQRSRDVGSPLLVSNQMVVEAGRLGIHVTAGDSKTAAVR